MNFLNNGAFIPPMGVWHLFWFTVFFSINTLFLPGLLFCQSFDTPESANAATVMVQLAKKDILFEVRPLLENFGGFGSSIHVPIQKDSGSTARENAGTFVLAVPLDSEFAVTVALSFIDTAFAALTETEFSNNLLVAFLADEKNLLEDSPFPHKGLRDLISLPDMPASWAVCYLDGAPAPESLVIRHGADDYIAPLALLSPLPALFNAGSVPFSLETRYNELFKLGLVHSSAELSLLYAGEIPGICLYGEAGSGQNAINSGHLAAALTEYALSLRLPLFEPDHQYTIFSLPSREIIFASENVFVRFLIAAAALFLAGLLVYSVRHRVKLISRIFLFLRKGWIFFLLVPLMVLIVLGSGFIYGIFHQVFKIPLVNADFFSSVLIIILAVWFFYVLSTFLDFLHFSRRADLYGVSAIIIAAMGLCVSAALDLSYVAIFLFAFLCSFIAGNSKRPVLVFVCSLLIPLRALGAFNNIRVSGGMPIYMFLTNLNSLSVMAAYQIAVLCLPVMLLLKRSMILFSLAKKKVTFGKRFRHRIKIAPSIMRFGFLGLILALMVVKVRFFTDNPEQLRRSFTADAADFSVSLSQTVFQESRIVNVALQSRVTPLVYRLRLTSEMGGPALVYSASVPFERLPDNSLEFMLGEHPPNPLNLEIVLSEGFNGVFEGEALYNKWENSLDEAPPVTAAGKEPASYLLTVYSRPAFLGE